MRHQSEEGLRNVAQGINVRKSPASDLFDAIDDLDQTIDMLADVLYRAKGEPCRSHMVDKKDKQSPPSLSIILSEGGRMISEKREQMHQLISDIEAMLF
jgi:hypothetical protein